MNADAQPQRVIITAGAQGLGRAMMEAFLAQGAHVHICDINPQTLADCKKAHPSITAHLADVSDPEQVAGFMKAAIAELGGIDVLINNAGIAGPTAPVEEMPIEGWQQTLNVNISGQFYCCQHVIPLMKAQRSGSIINISTTAALSGYPNRAPYCASKWAIIGLTKTLAMELGEHNIRANCICPGSINNPRMTQVIRNDARATNRSEEEVRQNYYKQVSMQTFIDPEEIANMAVFLSSPLAPHVSGQVISVDGHTETLRS